MTNVIKITEKWTLLFQRPKDLWDLTEFGIAFAVTRARRRPPTHEVIISFIAFGLGASLVRQ